MKYIFLVIPIFLILGCAGTKNTLMPKNKVFVVELEGKSMFSFHSPEGAWYLSSSVPKTIDRGFVNLTGVPPNSFVGYAINFSMTSIEGRQESLKSVVPTLKTHNFNAYLKRSMDSFTPAQQKEMNAKNYDGKVIYLQGYGCKNEWFEWKVAPQLNEGKGVPIFRNFIGCPLVVDGKIYMFNISIDSAVRPEYYTQKAEYDRTKRPEDPEINLDTDEILKTLGDKVIAMFKDIQFYGKVSQNYNDIANLEQLKEESPCNANLRYINSKECLMQGQKQEMLWLTKGQTVLVNIPVNNKRDLSKKDIFSFIIPDGIWFSDKKNDDKYRQNGRVEIYGEMAVPTASYKIALSVYRPTLDRKKAITYMQNQDWEGYASEPFNEYTLNQILDQNGRHFGQRAIMFKGLHCKNWWYQIYKDPDDTGRDDAGVFHNFVRCPLVIDGEFYEFNMSIQSAIKKSAFKQPNTTITLDDYLSGLAPSVISVFNDIQFHGKVSQNYEDVINK